MSQPEHFEILVLGSGEGGKYLAWHMAKSGHRTAVVERKLIGGSCPNTNCLPSKNEIWSADLVHHADRFGIVTGSTATDMKRVLARKREMVDGLIAMHLDRYKASGAELIMGTGRFIAPKTIEVKLNDGGTRVLAGDRVALNLGTHATIPDIPGLAAAEPLTNVETLELDRLPDHLIVLGGGYVGLELAQAYRRFGSRVSIVEVGPQLAGREDPDVADAVLEMLHDDGIEVHLGIKVLRVQGQSGQTVSLQMRTPAGDQTVEGSDLLVAAGRTPNTAGIGLDLAGVVLDDPARFKSSKQTGPHYGLTPRRYQSGETDRSGRISKIGDASVREALYQAAHVMLTKPVKGCPQLKSWAMRIARRAGMSKAKVALARKLAVILHRMLANETPFNAAAAAA